MFVVHPIWMMVIIVVAMAIFAWVISDMISTDVGSRPNGGRLRLGEKQDRRLD
jgi:hypothetical protein